MPMLLRICPSCRTYTLSVRCRRCGTAARSAHPARFSLPDTYGAYRRKAKLNGG